MVWLLNDYGALSRHNEITTCTALHCGIKYVMCIDDMDETSNTYMQNVVVSKQEIHIKVYGIL